MSNNASNVKEEEYNNKASIDDANVVYNIKTKNKSRKISTNKKINEKHDYISDEKNETP